MPAPTAPIDMSEVDHWAVNIVVREHVRMNLNYTEKLVALKGLKRQKLSDERICDILRVPQKELDAMVRRSYPRTPGRRAHDVLKSQPVS
jgi:hypothetical protein